uniref:Reverse transcriptase N-terminal domain-containing protein n=1 Tax=Polysiphonia sertularioides TaxID=945028 RepID=A0A1Z1MG53_9FLOR|nr:hypothetical protein [Polysiphonia sertularioides]
MKKSTLIKSSTYFSNVSKNIMLSKIHLRLSMLMKLIFTETKKHNLDYVYKLQNYLINCNEAKILVLSNLIPDTYYKYYDNIKNKLNNTQKNDASTRSGLYKIYEKVQKPRLERKIIKRHLEQNLVYLCIKPVWTARSIRYTNEIIRQESVYNKQKKCSFFSADPYLKKKLMSYMRAYQQVGELLEDLISLSCKSKYYIIYKKFSKNSKKTKLTWRESSEYLIVGLIYKILVNDLNWYLLNSSKKENSCKKLIKKGSQLHHRKKIDILSKKLLRTNDDRLIIRNERQLEYYTFKWFRHFYSKNKSFKKIKDSIKLNLYVNQILNSTFKKQSKSRIRKKDLLYKIKIRNSIINKLIYVNNLSTEYF